MWTMKKSSDGFGTLQEQDLIHIRHHSLFEPGVFQKYPALLDVYTKNGMGMNCRENMAGLSGHEESLKWPVIKGPGFCGATNPGAGKSFNGIMTGICRPVYNSDCLYINPGLRIFAVSDSPGITALSRNLFKEMDRRLSDGSIDDLERIIDELGRGMGPNEQATLALICFREKGLNGKDLDAGVFLAGDSSVYKGNVYEEQLSRVNGPDHFWGTSHPDFAPERVSVKEGDFFIIVSDGITALHQHGCGRGIEDLLHAYVKKDPENFAFNVTTACNSVRRNSWNGRDKTSLGGFDDITCLLVFPHQLAEIEHRSYIFGGTPW